MIFGPKTDAWLDLWSLEHFVSGMAISTFCVLLADTVFLQGVREIPKVAETRVYMITILLVEYMWEVGEFYMEAGYTHVAAITYWFQGVEFWGNRLVADPADHLVRRDCRLHHPESGAAGAPLLAHVPGRAPLCLSALHVSPGMALPPLKATNGTRTPRQLHAALSPTPFPSLVAHHGAARAHHRAVLHLGRMVREDVRPAGREGLDGIARRRGHGWAGSRCWSAIWCCRCPARW